MEFELFEFIDGFLITIALTPLRQDEKNRIMVLYTPPTNEQEQFDIAISVLDGRMKLDRNLPLVVNWILDFAKSRNLIVDVNKYTWLDNRVQLFMGVSDR